MSRAGGFLDGDPEVASLLASELERQRTTIQLIASENFTSPAVLAASASVLTNKYAEGYPGRRYYGGNEVADEVEDLARRRACALFGADHANVQPHAGASANLAAYQALLQPGDTILAMRLDQGGHLTHGSPVSVTGATYRFVAYGVTPAAPDGSGERIDLDQLRELARRERPQLIVAGATAYTRQIDPRPFREIADEVGARPMFDVAHPAGLIAAGVHPSPVGIADVVTFTTHKTLRGPRGGAILCGEELAKKIDAAVFPGLQGGPLEHTIAAKAVAFGEAARPEFKAYGARILENAAALAERLAEEGFRLVAGGTENHTVLVDLRDFDPDLPGKAAQEVLDRAGITCNRNQIPYDPRSPFVTSGLRLGTPAETTAGMGQAEMAQVASLLARALRERADEEALAKVRAEVRELCAAFDPYPGALPGVTPGGADVGLAEGRGERAEVGIYGDYGLVFGVAAAVTFLLAFPVRRLAERHGALAPPGAHHVHSRPTPSIGGAAMLGGVLVALLVAWRLHDLGAIFHGSSEPLGVALGALVIYGVGLLDDLRDISAPAKVAGEVLAAMVLVFLGVTMYYFKIPFVPGPIALSPSVLPLVTALWVVGMTNAVNLIDGLDGLAAGIVGIGSAALCIYALQIQHTFGALPAGSLGPLVAAITCGVCVGFLPHNFYPARTFMGDGGALLLGLLMAASTMLVGGRTVTSTGAARDVTGLTFFGFAPLFIPFFILGVPILDTLFAIVRRTVRRTSFAERDLGHLHHRLVRLGHGHRRAVLILWAWTAVLSAFVLLPAFDKRANALVPFGAAFLGAALYTVFRPAGRAAPAGDGAGAASGGGAGAASGGGAGAASAEGGGPAGPVTAPAGSAPMKVVMSGAVGVAVAGEPDLASPGRPRRRGRRRLVGPRRPGGRGKGAHARPGGGEVAGAEDGMRG